MLKKHYKCVNIHITWMLCIIILLPLSGLRAQNQLIRAGVISGLNLAQIDGDNYIGYHKTGIVIGGTAELPLSKKFSLAFEILYDQKGAYSHYPQNIYNPQYTYTYNEDYVNVPVLIQYFDKPFFCFSLGTSYGTLVKESNNLTGVYGLTTYDWNMLIDLRYFMTDHWVINTRFGYSILPIGKYSNNFYKNNNMYNKTLSLRLMYMFGHRHKFTNQN